MLARLPETPLAADLDIGGDAVLVGTDGGQIYRLAGDTAEEFCRLGSAWVGSVAVHRGAGLRAFAAGKTVLVLDRDGAEILNSDDHPSTVMGLSYSPNGRYIAAAHYGGVTIRNLAEPDQEKISLSWHGSHTAVAWSPCGRLIVTAMQDKEMHCWRWNDRTGLRMSGYPSKIRCISWTADGYYIAASGADTVTSWDCRGKGPTGKPPLEFGYVYNGVVMQVAAHPSDLVVAGGYSDGTVLIGNIEQESAMIARAGAGSAIAGLAWAPDGRTLVASDEAGTVAVIHVKDAIA
jgi:WD40 repeat protein